MRITQGPAAQRRGTEHGRGGARMLPQGKQLLTLIQSLPEAAKKKVSNVRESEPTPARRAVRKVERVYKREHTRLVNFVLSQTELIDARRESLLNPGGGSSAAGFAPCLFHFSSSFFCSIPCCCFGAVVVWRETHLGAMAVTRPCCARLHTC